MWSSVRTRRSGARWDGKRSGGVERLEAAAVLLGERSIDGGGAGHHRFGAPGWIDVAPAVRAHRRAQRRIGEECGDAIGERLVIVGADEVAGLSVEHDFRPAVDIETT